MFMSVQIAAEWKYAAAGALLGMGKSTVRTNREMLFVVFSWKCETACSHSVATQ